MKLNKASLFGLIAVLELANQPEQQLSTGDIADKHDISAHHLAKVMRHLVHEGVVQAVRGVGGGYRFAGNVNRTTLLDIIKLFENLESDLDLPHWSKGGDPVIEELQSITNEIDTMARAILDTITLATAIKNTHLRRQLAAQKDQAQGE